MGDLGAMKTKPAHALAATLAVSLIFALSRWGTYIHLGPIFITDVLIGLAAAHMLASWLNPLRTARTVAGPVAVSLLGLSVLYASVRLLLSDTYDLVALRDAMPYLYAVVGIIAALSYRAASDESKAKTAAMLHLALKVHLAWVLIALVLKLKGPALSGNTYVLQIRSDIDAALCAVLAGLSLVSALTAKKGRTASLLIAVVCAYAIFRLPNRSGLLSLSAVLLLVVVVYFAHRHAGAGKMLLVSAVPAGAMLLLAWLPSTTPGARLLATFGGAETQVEASAQGTSSARKQAWGILVQYWTADTWRFIFGVGFGPDFLALTGTNVLLGSETFEGVRSPHNYLIGTAMRLGLVGVVLTTVILLATFRAIWRLRDKLADDKLLLSAALTVTGLTPAAMVGVVFEAPFGAVPLFWAAGILLTAQKAIGLAKDSQAEHSSFRHTRTGLSSASRLPGQSNRL